MMRHNPSIFLLLAVMGLALSACSGSSNIKSEWSCPIDQPEGCFGIPVADDMAMAALAAESEADAPAPKAELRVTRSRPAASWSPSGDRGEAGSGSYPAKPQEEDPVTEPESDPAPGSMLETEDGPVEDGPVENGRDGDGQNGDGLDETETATAAIIVDDFRARQTTVSHPLFGLRIPERLAEVWLGPFEDEEGNYHPATRMVIIVRPAGWRLP